MKQYLWILTLIFVGLQGMDDRRSQCERDGQRLAQGSGEDGWVKPNYATKIANVVFLAKNMKGLWDIWTSPWQLSVSSKVEQESVWAGEKGIDRFIQPYLSIVAMTETRTPRIGITKDYDFKPHADVKWLSEEIKKRWSVATDMKPVYQNTILLEHGGAGMDSELKFIQKNKSNTKIYIFKCNIDEQKVSFVGSQKI